MAAAADSQNLGARSFAAGEKRVPQAAPSRCRSLATGTIARETGRVLLKAEKGNSKWRSRGFSTPSATVDEMEASCPVLVIDVLVEHCPLLPSSCSRAAQTHFCIARGMHKWRDGTNSQASRLLKSLVGRGSVRDSRYLKGWTHVLQPSLARHSLGSCAVVGLSSRILGSCLASVTPLFFMAKPPFRLLTTCHLNFLMPATIFPLEVHGSIVEPASSSVLDTAKLND